MVEPGDLEDLEDRGSEQTRASSPSLVRTRLSAPTEDPEPGRVEELDPVEVDDDVVATVVDQLDELLAQPGRGGDIDLAGDGDDRPAVALGHPYRQIHGGEPLPAPENVDGPQTWQGWTTPL